MIAFEDFLKNENQDTPIARIKALGGDDKLNSSSSVKGKVKAILSNLLSDFGLQLPSPETNPEDYLQAEAKLESAVEEIRDASKSIELDLTGQKNTWSTVNKAIEDRKNNINLANNQINKE